MRVLAIFRSGLSLGILVGAINHLTAAEPAADKPAEPARPKFSISKETTYITEPLRPDGYPDYIAALNRRMSQGVTPENNAAVLLQKVFGPSKIPQESRAQYFQQLGIAPLPNDGDYFVFRDEMLNRWKSTNPPKGGAEQDTLYEQFNDATERPWMAEEFPMVAEWLRLNEAHLQLAVQAIQRPNCFFPLFPDGPLLLRCKLHYAQQSREIAAALAARAMLRVAQNRIPDAWHDLLNCHRLARHIDNGSMFIESLVAIAIDAVATQAEFSLCHYGKLSTTELKTMQRELATLSPLRDGVEALVFGERLVCLDATTHVAQNGLLSIRDLSLDEERPFNANQIAFSDRNVDWNKVLRTGNQWFDRIEAIAKVVDRRQRRQDFLSLNRELKEYVKAIKEPRGILRDLASKNSREFITDKTASILVAMLLPSSWAVIHANDRYIVKEEMAQVAFALTAYRADNENYPDTLEALVPQYLKRVPDDLFKSEPGPIGYRRNGDAYLLWTVHVDGVDENGLTESGESAGDDYVLRPVPRGTK